VVAEYGKGILEGGVEAFINIWSGVPDWKRDSGTSEVVFSGNQGKG
jgi:hypothetical protein